MSSTVSWFAGLVDGEGCFTVSISKQHKHSLKLGLRFEISMKQGSWSLAAGALLQGYGIPFHTRVRKNQFQITVSGNEAVKLLIGILLPHLVVKKPLAQRLRGFPRAPRRNRFTKIDMRYVDAISATIDYVRRFNKGKNRRYKWDGNTIRAFYRK